MLSVWCIFFTVNAQRFQSTTGTAQPEDKWAVVEDPTFGGYVTIGNVINSAGISEVWISSYAANGVVATSSTATTGRNMIARDISLAPFDFGTGQPTYYVTGWTQVGGINQMFVGRIYLNGAFMWYQENPIGGGGNDKEGVAVVQAPNGDAVAVGHVMWPFAVPNLPLSPQIILTRFNQFGAILWSNTYNQAGFWKVREIANGVPDPGCGPSPAATPGEFIITGEVRIPPAFGGNNRLTAFAANYNGGGVECWRNLYPNNNPISTADAGYDVVFNNATGNYNIVGAAETAGGPRASPNSTPYLLEVNPFGMMVNGGVYLTPAGGPMGLYPRAVTLTNTLGEIAFAGPDYGANRTFSGRVPGVGALGLFVNYNGNATANSIAQPFWFSDGPTEGILQTNIPITGPGLLISTNANPGPWGNIDGHFIRTNNVGQTPDLCQNALIPNIVAPTVNMIPSNSVSNPLVAWGAVVAGNNSYPVQQKFCRDTCIVNAAFTYTTAGLVAIFTNGSTGNGTLSYAWTFGDGGTDVTANPTHTYTSPGTYVVCLTTTNVNSNGDVCTQTICQTIVVTSPCNIVPNFTYTVACKYKVTFTNTSTGTGPLTYLWTFDDGTTSTLTNPVKTFTTCGPHITKLRVCSPTCCDSILVTVLIPCCAVTSDFCLLDSGLSVKLIYNPAMNLPTTTYTVFVDGILTAWAANAFKTLTPGAHTICLKARRVSCPGDTCCATCCKKIFVSAPCTATADFWFQVQSTGNVVFTNKSLLATGYTYVYDFGDGGSVTGVVSPTHVYLPGTYTACLTLTKITGLDTCITRRCKTIVIDPPCSTLARFKSKYCLTTPLTVEFINYSVGTGSYLWDFGDGTTSVLASPTHTYTGYGTYVVCLTSTVNPNCWSKTCYTIIVSTTSCNNSCTTLPPPTVPRVAQNLIKPVESDQLSNQTEIDHVMVLESAIKSENGVKKDYTETLKNQVIAEQTKKIDKLSLFPNPASQRIQVLFETNTIGAGEIAVISSLGNMVYKKQVKFADGKNQFMVPIQQLANGAYFLRITSGNKIHSSIFSVKN